VVIWVWEMLTKYPILDGINHSFRVFDSLCFQCILFSISALSVRGPKNPRAQRHPRHSSLA